MKMTFQNYVDNPVANAGSIFTHRAMYRHMYTEKWDKLMLREAGKIDYTLYRDKPNDKYYIYIRIPSEVVKDFYYDVVVEFFTENNALRLSRSLSEYNVRFYSNDPAFCFTYAYAFKKNDLFIKELAPRISESFLKEKADERNPKNIVGYVKAIYFTYLFMKSKGLFSKIHYDTSGKDINFKELISVIEHSDIKIAKRQELGKQAENEKRQKKKEILDERDKARREAIMNKNTGAKIISKVKRIDPIAKIKKKGKIN